MGRLHRARILPWEGGEDASRYAAHLPRNTLAVDLLSPPTATAKRKPRAQARSFLIRCGIPNRFTIPARTH